MAWVLKKKEIRRSTGVSFGWTRTFMFEQRFRFATGVRFRKNTGKFEILCHKAYIFSMTNFRKRK